MTDLAPTFQPAADPPPTPAPAPAAPPAELDALHDPAPAPAATGPTPLLRGRIALFHLPDESLVIAFRPEGETETRQQVIPGMALAALAAMGGGSVPDLLAKLTESLT